MGFKIGLDRRRGRAGSSYAPYSKTEENVDAKYEDQSTPFDDAEVVSPLRRKKPKKSRQYE